jgi:hypothetical protein
MTIEETQKKFGVKTGETIGYPETPWSEHGCFNPARFFIGIQNKPSIDIMAYTFNCNLLGSSSNIKRVICNKIIGEIPKYLKYVLYKNLHSKMYIVYTKSGRLDCIWIGSQNFNSPTYLELMYKVRREDNKHFLSYFNSLWTLS